MTQRVEKKNARIQQAARWKQDNAICTLSAVPVVETGKKDGFLRKARLDPSLQRVSPGGKLITCRHWRRGRVSL